MGTLQFVDSMTGKLAWPFAAIILGLLFRESIISLLSRIKTLRWGEREAELHSSGDIEDTLQTAAREFVSSLPKDAVKESFWQDRITHFMQSGINAGYSFADPDVEIPPHVIVEWENGEPKVSAVIVPSMVEVIAKIMREHSEWPVTYVAPAREDIEATKLGLR